MAARTNPDALAAYESWSLIHGECGHRADVCSCRRCSASPGVDASNAVQPARWRPSTTASACSCSATSRAPSRRTPPPRWTATGSRPRSPCRHGSRTGSRPGSSPSPWPSARSPAAEFKVDDAHARGRGADALRRLGLAFTRGQEASSRRSVVQGAAQARLRAPRADRDRGRGGRDAHAACRGRMLRHREGFALTDEGFDLVRADRRSLPIWRDTGLLPPARLSSRIARPARSRSRRSASPWRAARSRKRSRR